MRTLATQLRLRQLIRALVDYGDRLVPGDEAALAAFKARLLALLAEVRAAWDLEAGSSAPVAVRRHVLAQLSELAAAVEGFGRVTRAPAALQEAASGSALGLLLMLRGLEDLPEAQLAAWLGARPLARTA